MQEISFKFKAFRRFGTIFSFNKTGARLPKSSRKQAPIFTLSALYRLSGIFHSDYRMASSASPLAGASGEAAAAPPDAHMIL